MQSGPPANGSASDQNWLGLGGDGTLDPGHTLSMNLYFSPITVSGSDEVGIYARPGNVLNASLSLNSSGVFTLNYYVWTSPSTFITENLGPLPFSFTGTASSPQEVTLNFSNVDNSASVFNMGISSDGVGSGWQVSGALSAVTAVNFSLSNSGGSSSLGFNSLAVTQPVPEPGVTSLVCVGVIARGGWLAFKRRRRVIA